MSIQKAVTTGWRRAAQKAGALASFMFVAASAHAYEPYPNIEFMIDLGNANVSCIFRTARSVGGLKPLANTAFAISDDLPIQLVPPKEPTFNNYQFVVSLTQTLDDASCLRRRGGNDVAAGATPIGPGNCAHFWITNWLPYALHGVRVQGRVVTGRLSYGSSCSGETVTSAGKVLVPEPTAPTVKVD
jgi:hypothetical protein